MKKIVTVLLAIVLTVSMFTLSACNKDPLKGLEGEYDITVWVSEIAGVKELTERQIDAFETAHPGIIINATIEGITEAESATQMVTSVEDGADIFCFAQDQLARLVMAGALAKLGKKASATITDINDAGAVAAATVGGDLYCYPLTSDNGYFMYYDKSVIQESSLDDLAAIVADCEAANKNFSYELENSAWYNAGFFFATGCKSAWTTNLEGVFTAVDDDFNSANGLIAMKGMQILLKSDCYFNSSNTADFAAPVPSAVVISGTWGANAAKDALGDNFASTDLPSFTVDNQTYHLSSYSGNKLLGVKPQVDAGRATVLQELAMYLTNEECQLQRFEEFAWGPSNKAAQDTEAVKSNAILSALAAQNEFSVPQGQIHGSWWDIAKVLATKAKTATTAAELETALDVYQEEIDKLFSMSEEERNAFTTIGSINGDTWSIDLPMTESPTGVWTTDQAYTMDAGVEFKVRKGKSWDEAYGNGTGNFVVETAGTYYIRLTITGETATVELVPAE